MKNRCKRCKVKKAPTPGYLAFFRKLCACLPLADVSLFK